MTGAQIAQAVTSQRTVLPGRPDGERRIEGAFRIAMYLAVGFAFVSVVTLLAKVAIEGVPNLSLTRITEQAFTSDPTDLFASKTDTSFTGFQSAILGTLYLMVLTALFVLPVGVATAVYLEEYADRKKWFNKVIEVNIQNLAAVPSVVYGILGLAFIVRSPLSLGNTVLAGALTLGLLVLPVVIIVSREAIRAVPPSIREGSLALGATKWQTVWKQVLPGSIAGIATGGILALSRAIGETAPLIVIGAAATKLENPGLNPFDGTFTALPMAIFSLSKDANQDLVQLASVAIVLLMVVLLAMNSVAIYLRTRYEQKW